MAGDSFFSDSVHVAIRPFSFYAQLGAQAPRSLKEVTDGPLTWLLLIAGCVSIFTAGRLVAFHLVMVSAAWVPLLAVQFAWVVIAARIVDRTRPLAAVIHLHFAGQLPWLAFFLVLAGVCIFAPHVWPVLRIMLTSGALFVGIGAVTLWSTLLTWAMFRAGLALSIRRAALGVGVYYGGYAATVVVYYLLTGQLRPLLS